MAALVEAYSNRVDAKHKLKLEGTQVSSTFFPSGNPSLKSKSIDLVLFGSVYINEESDARKIILRVAPGAQVPKSVVPRNDPTPINTTMIWRCEAHKENLSVSRIGAEYQAELRGTEKQIKYGKETVSVREREGGQSYQFKTSTCGLDRYRVRLLVSPHYSECVSITVRKRIPYYYVQMLKSAGQGAQPYTMNRPLEEAVAILSQDYGIDLVRKNTAQVTIPWANTLTSAQLSSSLTTHVPAFSNRGPRDLFLVAVNQLTGAIGYGGGSVAAVAVGQIQRQAGDPQHAGSWYSWQQAYRQWKQQGGHGTVDEWLQHQQNLTPREREFYAWLIKKGDAGLKEAVISYVRSVLIHEIGHAFRLVPTNGMAGGMNQAGWYDTAPNHSPGHCAKRSCVMWWEADAVANVPGIELKSKKPFDHYFQGEVDDGCALHLTAYPLSDIKSP